MRFSVTRRSLTLFWGIVLTASLVAGCKVTAEDVEYWKTTVKGPGKIVAVILADKYPLELRTRAALALVEMEPRAEKKPFPAIDPVAELQRALDRLPDDKIRQDIIDGMVPGLEAILRGQTVASQAMPTSGSSTVPKQQVRAKDAAFLLVSRASPQSRERLVRAVIAWYSVDFFGRSTEGQYSAEQVVRQLGAGAAAQLVDAMNARGVSEGLMKITELIGQIGDDATKQRAGERLIAIEREMESPEFLEWLKEKIRTQLREQKVEAQDARITAAAEANRETFINGALSAMKFLASQSAVAARLLEIASTNQSTPAMTARRTTALQALEGAATRAHLQPLLTLALDPAAPTSVRDYAFDRVGDIRSPEAIPPLWPLVQASTDQRLRWRAGAMLLQIGGPGIIPEFLAKLPPPGDDGYAPEELDQYASIMGNMNPAPTELLRAQLRAPQWWLKVIALRYFERKGTAPDIAGMESLRGDSTPLVGPKPPRSGWPEGHTVGKVAEESISAARQRLGQGQAQGATAPPGTPARAAG